VTPRSGGAPRSASRHAHAPALACAFADVAHGVRGGFRWARVPAIRRGAAAEKMARARFRVPSPFASAAHAVEGVSVFGSLAQCFLSPRNCGSHGPLPGHPRPCPERFLAVPRHSCARSERESPLRST
jgi:hypothetical protein